MAARLSAISCRAWRDRRPTTAEPVAAEAGSCVEEAVVAVLVPLSSLNPQSPAAT